MRRCGPSSPTPRSLGYNDVTDGSRTTFATGMATILAARDAIKKLCARAAQIWGIPADAVTWEKGHAKPAGANAGNFPPLSLAEIAAQAARDRRADRRTPRVSAPTAPASASPRISAMSRSTRRPARTKIMRYTVLQDAGKAVHPSYVEGQFQGGAVQGIGWALNEEYIYGKDGRLQNAGFLDYRIPVCSDLPMIDTVILEIPNPGPSVRRARRRRDVDRAAAGGRRQRGLGRGRRADDRACRCRRRRSWRRSTARPRRSERTARPMVKVVVWGSLKPHTGGEAELEIEAGNVRELLARLGETYPGLKPQLERGVSVSIDGVIFRDGWHEPLRQDSEVFLLPRMVGG